MRYWIIKTATTERVQSGICYMAEWLYAALAEAGHQVEIEEDVTVQGFDKLKKDHPEIMNSMVIVDLSSYPQADICGQIYRDCRGRMNIKFFGYEAMIDQMGLPKFDPVAAGVDIMVGVRAYGKYVSRFRSDEVGDYDSHVLGIGSGKPFEPVFLSVGCDRKCPYCYVGYSNFPKGELTVSEAEEAIWSTVVRDRDIHFYDEDFFAYPHLEEVLGILEQSGTKWICLATSKSLAAAIKKFGADRIQRSGNVLTEIGLETMDRTVLSKEQRLDELLNAPLNYFWLTVTFFPDETLESKARTGRFLEAFGWTYDSLVPRIRSNSSHGGLGQFFVPYIGTPWWTKFDEMGRCYGGPPTRLWPSFIGHRFLQQVPNQTGKGLQDIDRRWASLYVDEEQFAEVLDQCRGKRTVNDIMSGEVWRAVVIAQAAQLGMVI